ncbi:toll-like receptor 5 isoform X3 [Cervus canadensis]|uniref:toll-like receptor 5 isoform X3 n=1 Tax=Cervus canadensis TaxID=1574408 RepID=UPI001C9E5762|nr:toll-like receptor 5 isoform X3 [Cervus canadensis]
MHPAPASLPPALPSPWVCYILPRQTDTFACPRSRRVCGTRPRSLKIGAGGPLAKENRGQQKLFLLIHQNNTDHHLRYEEVGRVLGTKAFKQQGPPVSRIRAHQKPLVLGLETRVHWFSDVNVHQNHPEGLIEQPARPCPRASDSGAGGVGGQVALMLLVQGHLLGITALESLQTMRPWQAEDPQHPAVTSTEQGPGLGRVAPGQAQILNTAAGHHEKRWC